MNERVRWIAGAIALGLCGWHLYASAAELVYRSEQGKVVLQSTQGKWCAEMQGTELDATSAALGLEGPWNDAYQLEFGSNVKIAGCWHAAMHEGRDLILIRFASNDRVAYPRKLFQ